jgi:hypothetical protein
VFEYCDADSMAFSLPFVCSQWNATLEQYKNQLWKQLCFMECPILNNISLANDLDNDWKQLYVKTCGALLNRRQISDIATYKIHQLQMMVNSIHDKSIAELTEMYSCCKVDTIKKAIDRMGAFDKRQMNSKRRYKELQDHNESEREYETLFLDWVSMNNRYYL